MMKQVIFSFALFFTAFSAVAQDSLKMVKRVRIDDIGAQLSISHEFATSNTVEDFRTMYPESDFLKADLSNYTHQNGFSSLTSGPVLFVFTSFKFSNKNKTAYRPNVRLRAGLSLNSFQLYTHYNQEINKPFDSIPPYNLYIDSVTRRTYSTTYSGTQVRADISFLWSTNQEKRRLAVYTGIGITAGVSVRANGSAAYTIYNDLALRNERPSYTSDTSKTKYRHEILGGKTNYGFSAYVPLGADLRLGNKRPFWRRSHIYYEVRPVLNMMLIPRSRTFTNFGIQHGWGLRFNL